MSLEVGSRLGHYDVTALIGEGGMGQVYQATDTKLNRQVALKILPEAFAGDPDRLARFQREAQVLASLNHPGIAAIYGLEEEGDTRALVLELVEGPTLADRIAQGPIPIDEALPIAKQIAEALEAAHEAGVIHRDLKPANIKVREDGTVKVLDFGLAKALDTVPEGDPSLSPTLTAAATQMGVIMGTAAYMSPEQARGSVVDSRADVWSFGVVLYEMLTGARLFDGATVSDTLASVLKTEPDWQVLSGDIPASIRKLLRRSLNKDRKERLRHIGDARLDIDEAITTSGAEEEDSVPAAGTHLNLVRHGVSALLGASALAVGLLLSGILPAQAPGVERTVTRTSVTLPEGQRQPRMQQAPLAISPDGTILAYVARDESGAHLFLRRLDSFETRKVPDSENATGPFFSPNGQWVGFIASGRLKKFSVEQGSTLILTRADLSHGATWGPDDTIVFAKTLGSGLWQVSADGGEEPVQLTQPDFGDSGFAHVWPQFLPGGRHILFGLWGKVDAPQILSLDTGTWHRARDGVITGGDMYLTSGHLVYGDPTGSGAFFAAPFSLDELAVMSSPASVLDDVRFFGSQSARPFITVSETGTAVYVTQEVGDARVNWVSRTGAVESLLDRAGAVAGLRLSPTGDRAVFHDEQGSLWLLDVDRGNEVLLLRGQFTPADTHLASSPVWRPHSQRVTFSLSGDSWDLYEIDTLTRETPVPLLEAEFDQTPGTWSADGRLLVYCEQHPVTGSDIWMYVEGGEPIPVVRTENSEFSPTLSPDGRLLAYVSDESGRLEVYVRTYPEGEIQRVSADGGEEPVWSKDGTELFFRDGDQLLSARIDVDATVDVAAPRQVLELPFDRNVPGDAWSGAYYDVAIGSEQFLLVSERPTTEFQVIQNWFSELERLAPTN